MGIGSVSIWVGGYSPVTNSPDPPSRSFIEIGFRV